MKKPVIIYLAVICLFLIGFQSDAYSVTKEEFKSNLESEKFKAQPGIYGRGITSEGISPYLSESIDVNKYILGPGDMFTVYITGKSGLGYSVGIYPDGKIYIPVIGPVLAKGKTINQLKYILKKKFSRYYLPPLYFNIVINDLKFIKVEVVGQVDAPGIYATRDGSDNTKKLVNFLKLAEGFNDYADYDNIEIIRKEKGRVKRYIISFTDINEGRLTQNIVLRTGDTVFVPKRINTIYVLGHVNRPGGYNYTSKSTILDFIAQAGGLAKNASDTINIIRREDGENKVIKTSLKRLLKHGMNDKIAFIKPRDIVFIGKGVSLSRIWSGMLGFMNVIKYSLTVPRDTLDAWYDLTTPGRSPVTETSK